MGEWVEMHNHVPNRVRLHHQIDQAFLLFLRATLKNRGSGLGTRQVSGQFFLVCGLLVTH
jgi:hypothetical protein